MSDIDLENNKRDNLGITEVENLAIDALKSGASQEEVNALTDSNAPQLVPSVDAPQGDTGAAPAEQVAAPTPVDDVPATEPTGPITEHGRKQQIMNEMSASPRAADLPGIEPTQGPTFGQSVEWAMEDFGVTQNVMRLMDQQMTEPVPEDEARIVAAMPELMDGVSEEYWPHIASMPTMEVAIKEADHLRQKSYRDRMRENEGLGQALAAGGIGFVADPVNLVPGALVFKGMGTAAKIGVSLGMRSAATNTVAKNMVKLGTLAATEEAIRNAPRLHADPTYEMDEYLTDAAMGLALGIGAPLIKPARTALSRATRNKAFDVAGQMEQTAHDYGIDTMARSALVTVQTAARQMGSSKGVNLEEGLITSFQKLDVAKAWRTARRAVDRSERNKLREFRNINHADEFRKAAASDDTVAAADILRSHVDRVVSVMERWKSWEDDLMSKRKPDPKAKPDGPKVKSKLEESIEKVASFGQKMYEASQTMGDANQAAPRHAGAAQRKETLGTKAEDAIHDIQDSQTYKDISDKAQVIVDELDKLREGAPENRKPLVDDLIAKTIEARDRAQVALNQVRQNNGRRPVRTRLTNKKATEAIDGQVGGMRKASSTSVREMMARLKGVDLGGYDLAKKTNGVVRGAIRHAMDKNGMREIGNKPGDMKAAMEKMSHVQRKAFIRDVYSSFNVNSNKVLDDITFINTKNSDIDKIAREAVHHFQKVRDEIDVLGVMARNPYEDMLAVPREWAGVSSRFRENVDMAELHKQFVEDKVQRGVKSQFGPLSESLASRMYRSESPLAGYFSSSILETPSGFGGKLDRNNLTAAITAENEFNRSRLPVLVGWEEMMQEIAAKDHWGVVRRMRNKQGNARTHADVRQISEEVMLEVNARQWGTASKSRPEVKAFVDKLTKAYGDLHDLQNGHVAGIHDGNKIDNYMHQAWDDSVVLKHAGSAGGRTQLKELFRHGYMNAGMDMEKAGLLADAMIDQKLSAAARTNGNSFHIGDEQINGMMPELMDIVDRLKKNGAPEKTIREIIETINGTMKGDKPGYANTRAPIDLNASAVINGETVRVVDLMDKDVPGVFTKYSKEATGRVAISKATHGRLDSDDAMNGLLNAMAQEGQALGTTVHSTDARNALMMIMGRTYDGQLPMDLRRVRDAVSLAGMGGLGESQLAELGLAMNRGFHNVTESLADLRTSRKVRTVEPMFLSDEQKKSRTYMRELQEASGLFEEMYLIDRRNVHFDAKEADMGVLGKMLDTGTGGKYRPLMQHAQSRFTGYGVLRTWEDQLAMGALTSDIAKAFSGRKAFTSEARFRDLGVDLGPNSKLRTAFDKYAEVDDDGIVKTLNLHSWSKIDKDAFGVVLNRYASQQIQKGFVGESSPMMMNPQIAFMLQFRSYPMLAAEKQQARHLKFADKEAATGMMLNAVSSGASRFIRAQSMAMSIPEEKREAYLAKKLTPGQFAWDTHKYMATAGMFPELSTYVTTAAGWQHPYSRNIGSPSDLIPALSFAQQYGKAVQSSANPLDIDERDLRNIQTAAPLGTISFSNLLFGILRDDTEVEEK